MKNKAITIFAIILLIPGFSFAQADRTPNGKKVPVVVYTPFDFYGRLMDAFRCGPEQDYYVVGEDNHSIFDNRIGSGYYSGAYQERELREGRILNISDFKDAIMSNDSCFFFAPLPSRKYDNAYLGIKNGKNFGSSIRKGASMLRWKSC